MGDLVALLEIAGGTPCSGAGATNDSLRSGWSTAAGALLLLLLLLLVTSLGVDVHQGRVHPRVLGERGV